MIANRERITSANRHGKECQETNDERLILDRRRQNSIPEFAERVESSRSILFKTRSAPYRFDTVETIAEDWFPKKATISRFVPANPAFKDDSDFYGDFSPERVPKGRSD